MPTATTELNPKQREQFRKDGYVVLADPVFEADLIQRVRGEFHRLWQEAIERDERANAKDVYWTRVRPFLSDTHRASAPCRELLTHPVLMGFARQFVGPDVECLYNQAVIKAPCKDERNSFAWHQDAYYAIHSADSDRFDHAAIQDPRRCFVCWVAISEVTAANGTLWVAPGEHRRGLLPHVRLAETGEWDCQCDNARALPVELPPGGMVIFSLLLPHRSGPNTTGQPRMAFQFTYSTPGVRRIPESVFPVLTTGQPVRS